MLFNLDSQFFKFSDLDVDIPSGVVFLSMEGVVQVKKGVVPLLDR